MDIPVVTSTSSNSSAVPSLSPLPREYRKQLVTGLATYAPSVSSASVFAAGATEIRDLFRI
ncbi:uncharacterized protein N7529_004565 [Penicillium soppii]|uniref:uncharacterized protein n=1 Tax=Penicillium soppii TaxID=69789 RepID=UPI00254787EC|nr:uncharacterized protein N7529_004565 [Penicillium soppii]KAJ5872212.1 hypothetical protein N7529_004565 [Penicillium soppii]